MKKTRDTGGGGGGLTGDTRQHWATQNIIGPLPPIQIPASPHALHMLSLLQSPADDAGKVPMATMPFVRGSIAAGPPTNGIVAMVTGYLPLTGHTTINPHTTVSR